MKQKQLLIGFLPVLILLQLALIGQSIDTQMIPAFEIGQEQYCMTIQIKSDDGAQYVGTSSLRINYDATVINFQGSTFGVSTGSYTSINFDDDQDSLHPECDSANGGLGATPYSEHGFDGLVPGDILITIVLLNPTLAGNVFACPNIAGEWEDLSTICFDVLDPNGNPHLQFVGTQNGPVEYDGGNNFNTDDNDPANKYDNGTFTGLSTPFNQLVSGTITGCTDQTACNYNSNANAEDGSCIYATTWYADADGDGLGNPNNSVIACDQPLNFVANNEDDNDAPVFISGCTDAEACNFDPEANLENGTCEYGTIWYIDADQDGLGNPNNPIQACEQPEGYVANGTDTDDMDPTGIEDFPINFQLVHLGPIPAKNELNIVFSNNHFVQQMQLLIYNVNGQLIETLSIEAMNNENTIKLDLKEYASGIYFAKLNDGLQAMDFKFIKK